MRCTGTRAAVYNLRVTLAAEAARVSAAVRRGMMFLWAWYGGVDGELERGRDRRRDDDVGANSMNGPRLAANSYSSICSFGYYKLN
jgi:hypothetical protein